jgi:hypothetical protein
MLGAAGGFSCSSSSSQKTAEPPQGTASVTPNGPSATLEPTAQGTRIFGPQLELVRDSKGIRGHGPIGVVDLRPDQEKGRVSGVIGTGPTNLHIEPTPEGSFTMRGMFAGNLGELEVTDDRIQGQLGHCQYNLRAADTPEAGKAYNGDRWCGRARATTTLKLSPQIESLDPVDRGALIAILLGR